MAFRGHLRATIDELGRDQSYRWCSGRFIGISRSIRSFASPRQIYESQDRANNSQRSKIEQFGGSVNQK